MQYAQKFSEKFLGVSIKTDYELLGRAAKTECPRSLRCGQGARSRTARI